MEIVNVELDVTTTGIVMNTGASMAGGETNVEVHVPKSCIIVKYVSIICLFRLCG